MKIIGIIMIAVWLICLCHQKVHIQIIEYNKIEDTYEWAVKAVSPITAIYSVWHNNNTSFYKA